MKVEQKKTKLIEDLVYQNGQLNCKLTQKNIKIAERIKKLSISLKELELCKTCPNYGSLIKTLENEIIWLKELANI